MSATNVSTVLVVDDKESLRDSVGFTLQRAGFAVVSAPGGEAALELIARRRPDAVVTDLRMPGMTGLELIERVRAIDADLPIVLMTAFGTIDTAVQAVKLGAYDYITKPFEGDELVIAVKRAMEHRRLRRENAVLRASAGSASGTSNGVAAGADLSGMTGLERVIGESVAMVDVKSRLEAVASSHGTVLIAGESGTGKEVVARAIHEMSPRSAEPFLAVNCAAMSESLLESELFGHERGAFTGAESLRKGRFELAHGGTLLLDEISEVKPQIQAKLLRVLQERAFERVGSSTTIGVDVRVIATTNRDLASEVAAGRFRQDLYFRLNVLPLHLPALRDRASDVELLAPHFVARIAAREGREAPAITREAMDLLGRYPWPGNVRELQNLCERAVVLSRGSVIDAELIRLWLTGPGVQPRARARVREAWEMSPGGHVGFGGVDGPDGRAVADAASSRSWSAMNAAWRTAPAGVGPVVGGGGFGGELEASLVGGAVDVPSLMQDPANGEPRRLADIERDVIVETLMRFDGHRQRTAEALGIGVRTLGLKIKKWKEERLVSPTL